MASSRSRPTVPQPPSRTTPDNPIVNQQYSTIEPTRAEIDAQAGAVLLEFGTSWCGHCRAAQPLLVHALADFPTTLHMKVEDGSGRKLGRSFGVKLWPTLIFLRDGQELSRMVRPTQTEAIRQALVQLHSGARESDLQRLERARTGSGFPFPIKTGA